MFSKIVWNERNEVQLVVINIQARDFSLTDAIHNHIKDRINYQFGSRFDQIQCISVCLSDVNGPRGGVDKCCKVTLTLPRLNEIVIEDIQADLYVAIYRAMDRASRTVNRKLARLQDTKRRLDALNKSKSERVINGQL